jgi:hypothetical protein
MSSFDTTPLNVYLIIVFSLALIAAVLAIAGAGYELVRHRRSVSRAQDPSGVAGSASPPFMDHLVAHAGRRTKA